MVDKLKLQIVVESFGLKTKKEIPQADLYLDARVLPDPAHFGGGSIEDMQIFMHHHANPVLMDLKRLVYQSLLLLEARRGSEKLYSEPFHILTMCARGCHRSVVLKHEIVRYLNDYGYLYVEVK